METEMVSYSLHDFKGFKKKLTLATYDFKLWYKYIFMIKCTDFEFKSFKVPQKFKLNKNSG